MSQADSYSLFVDFDRDGFFCEASNLTDPLNLVPSPVRWRGLYYSVVNSATATLSNQTTDYGIKVLTIDTTAHSTAGARIGYRLSDGRYLIPVTAGVQYTAKVWLKVTNSPADFLMRISVDDQTGTQLATVSITATAAWVGYTATFTAGDNSSAVRINVLKRSTSVQIVADTAGYMLVQGNSAPAIFNAGRADNFYENVFPFVESVDWSYGCSQYSEAVAPPAQMTIAVNNQNGEFTPGVGVIGSVLSKGCLIYFKATEGGTDYPLFIGTLDSIHFDVGADNNRRAILTVIDPMPQLLSAFYTPALQQNVTTDQVLQAVFDSQVIVYPNPGWFWILGASGFSELSETTWLVEQDLTNFEVGDTTFDFAGDITGADASLSAQSFLREYVYAEFGRFFYDAPTGQFKFFNRTHDVNQASNTIVPGVLELDDPPEFVYADDVTNHFTLNYYPRVTGAAASTLYPSSVSPLTISAGESKTFSARYQDPTATNATVAGVNMITPVSGLDYIANSASDGSGADKTAFIGISVNFLATSASVTLTNYDAATVYLTTFQLRGTPLTAYTRASVSVNDGISTGMQGDFRKTIELTALGDDVLAAAYANYLLQRYKTPIGRIGAASLWGNRDDATLLNVLTLGVGSYVEIDDAFLQNESSKYIVTALHHNLTPIHTHWLRMSLEPLDRSLYWILGDATLSILNSTTRLSL